MNNKSDISNEIFHSNVKWLLHSGIRIKNGPDRGAMYGWKNLNSGTYPFIYNEIVGYSITAFSWIYSELGEEAALSAAKDASYWIMKNLEHYGYLLPAGRKEIDTFNEKGDLANLIYAFDNGMIVTGLLNLHKLTADLELLNSAEAIAQAVIKRFYVRSNMVAVLDRNFKPISSSKEEVKWSMVSGSYHCKLALGLLDLSDLTDNNLYRKVSHSICDSLGCLQTTEGRFITNPRKGVTYLHPHLYTCEGLIYSGMKDHNEDYYRKGLNGLKWAIKSMLNNGGILPRSTLETGVDQSDCISQLLRLTILCRTRLLEETEFCENFLLDEVIEKLHVRLLDFYISLEEDKGAMKYQLDLDSACSWCTMFSSQALGIWKKRNEFKRPTWVNFYI
jgi:hypothetical protein